MTSRPLHRWTRPLTAEERDQEVAADRWRLHLVDILNPPKEAEEAGERCLSRWRPILTREVPTCRVCTLPYRDRLCGGCKKLVARFGFVPDSLEFLAVVDKRTPPESLMWDWKEQTTLVDGRWTGPHDLLTEIAMCLAAYTESHADRLLEGDPVIAALPSRAPLIAAAFAVAKQQERLSLRLSEVGAKSGDWFQHEMHGQAERLSRRMDDWDVHADAVAGRPVLLFDDVFVSGASMFSFAAALKRAGAREVRAVAVGRHIADNHNNYYDAARILRRTRAWYWSAGRAVVTRPF